VITVGELSRRTGVTAKALREYTDWGLIDTLGRSQANYRLYPPDAVWCVQAIAVLRGLGLNLAEIRQAARVAEQDRHEVGRGWRAGCSRPAPGCTGRSPSCKADNASTNSSPTTTLSCSGHRPL
jgi:DNA-binding transcriptional MerR regulator